MGGKQPEIAFLTKNKAFLPGKVVNHGKDIHQSIKLLKTYKSGNRRPCDNRKPSKIVNLKLIKIKARGAQVQ